MQAPRHRQPRRDRGKFAGKDNTLQPVEVQGKKVLLKTVDNHIAGHRAKSSYSTARLEGQLHVAHRGCRYGMAVVGAAGWAGGGCRGVAREGGAVMSSTVGGKKSSKKTRCLKLGGDAVVQRKWCKRIEERRHPQLFIRTRRLAYMHTQPAYVLT